MTSLCCQRWLADAHNLLEHHREVESHQPLLEFPSESSLCLLGRIKGKDVYQSYVAPRSWNIQSGLVHLRQEFR